MQERIDEREYFDMDQKDTRFNDHNFKAANNQPQADGDQQDSPTRTNKLKRTRSSFNLSDKILKQSESGKKIMDISSPQIKPINRKNHSSADHLIEIEPRMIIKEAYKAVDSFGS